jgi:PAS domain S-box-containing protein
MTELNGVLLLDDQAEDRLPVIEALAEALPDFPVRCVASAEEFSSLLEEGRCHLVVLESRFGGIDGLDFVRAIRARSTQCPVIMFTAAAGEEMAVEAMKTGVDDYIVKAPANLPRLVKSIQTAIERYRRGADLRESRRVLQTLMSNLPGMAYRCRNDPEWTMEFVSEGCRELTGYAPEELIENRVVSYAGLILASDRPAVWDDVQTALAERRSFQMIYRIRAADGAVKWVWEKGCGIHNSHGQVEALEGFISDVTERKRAELGLQHLHRAYRAAIQNARGVPYQLDFRDGTYGFFSEGLEALLGIHVTQLTQKEFARFVQDVVIVDPEAPASRQGYFDAFLEGKVKRWLADYRVRTASGEERWLNDCATPIRDEATGRVVGSLGILYDVTERKHAEDKLRESNRLLSTLNAVSRATAFSRSTDEFTDALVRELRRVLPFDSFFLDAFHIGARRSISLGNFDTVNGLFQRVPIVNPNLDWSQSVLFDPIFQQRRPMLINRSPEELKTPHSGLVPFGDTTRPSASLTYLPLMVGNRVIGIMGVHSYTPNAFGLRETEFVQAVANQVAPAVEGLVLSRRMARTSAALQSVVAGTSATMGADFFRSLVRNLASAADAQFALLGEFKSDAPNRIQVRAFWAEERGETPDDFSLEGSLFEAKNGDEISQASGNLAEQFPGDPYLKQFSNGACLGVRVRDSAGRELGVLEVARENAFEEDLDLGPFLRILAARAGVELERMRAEEALRISESEYRNLFENAQVAIFRTRVEDGLLLAANQRFAELIGERSPEDVVERFVARDHYVDPGVRDTMLQTLQEKGHVSNFEARIRLQDGSIHWILYSARLNREDGYLEGVISDITRRKEMEHALRDTNDTLQALVRASPVGILGFTPDQRILMWNPAAERIFGWTREEMLAMTPPVLPTLGFESLSAFQKNPESGKGFARLDLRGRRKDGREIEISMSMAPLRDANARVSGAVAIVSDITEEKRATRERAVFAQLGLQLAQADTPEAMAKPLARAADELLRFDSFYFDEREPGSDHYRFIIAYDIIDGERRDITHTLTRTTKAYGKLGRLLEGEPYLLNREQTDEPEMMAFGDVTRRSASLIYAPLILGSELCGVISVQSYQPFRYTERDRDLLKSMADLVAAPLRRAQAEVALRRSEATNRALLEAIPDMIFVLDKEGCFIDCKAQPEELLVPPSDFLGKHVTEVLPKKLAGKTLRRIHRVLSGSGIVSFEYQLPIRGGSDYEARMVQCGPDEVLLIVRNITERKRLETQLQQAQKMEAIGRLAGGVAHDFNNLLTGIVGNLGLLEMDVSERDRPVVEEALKASQRAADLVSQLLAFSRKTRVSPQPIDLAEIVREAAGIVRKTCDPRIEIRVDMPPTVRRVLADPGQIHQVVLNLCINARDAVAEVLEDRPGDELRIRLQGSNADLDQIAASAHPDARPGRYVRLAVSDTGAGMDAEVLSHLFEPFFTTKELGKGTGLGLATLYGIVRQHNGWIEVESSKQRGSVFTVYLPAAADDSVVEEPGRPERTDVILSLPHGTETILVADDEGFIRRLARRTLEPLGYTILEAADGDEAVAIYKKNKDSVQLVILDLFMPKTPGKDALKKLRALSPHLKVILSSGYAQAVETPERIGASGYIGKPYQPGDLAHTVRRVLDA